MDGTMSDAGAADRGSAAEYRSRQRGQSADGAGLTTMRAHASLCAQPAGTAASASAPSRRPADGKEAVLHAAAAVPRALRRPREVAAHRPEPRGAALPSGRAQGRGRVRPIAQGAGEAPPLRPGVPPAPPLVLRGRSGRRARRAVALGRAGQALPECAPTAPGLDPRRTRPAAAARTALAP